MSGGQLHHQRGIEAWIADTNKRLAALERSVRMPFSAVDSEGVTYRDGGAAKFLDSLENLLAQLDTAGLRIFEGDGSVLMTLDGDKLLFNRSDGSRILEITPGGGVAVYASDGSTQRMVLDGSGLVLYAADGTTKLVDLTTVGLRIYEDGDTYIVNPSDSQLDTTDINGATLSSGGSLSSSTITYTIPSWASTAKCLATADIEVGSGQAGIAYNTQIFINSITSRGHTNSDSGFAHMSTRAFGHEFTGTLPADIDVRIDFDEPILLGHNQTVWCTLVAVFLAEA